MKTGLYSNDVVLELDNIKKLTNILSNPQNDLKFIHVSGTNGKGSVCAFLQSVLTLSGFSCGKFTSPDIITPCDSISVNGENIDEDTLNSLYSYVKNTAVDFSPSDFEILTASAFLYFKEKNCDFVILETGLGGTGDATNIISSPLYSVITKISIDHTTFLGNTLEKIAEKKAGIIKHSSKTVTLKNQNSSVLKIISDKCKKENNTLILTKEPEVLEPIKTHEHFLYDGLEIVSGFSGVHQVENASLAIEVLKDLRIEPNIITEGIKRVKNPARFETICENPLMIFDGAHNADGVEAMLLSLSRYYPNTQKNLVIGMMRDKDIKGTIKLLKKYNENTLSKIFTVEVLSNPRSENPEVLKDAFCDAGFLASNALTLKNALAQIKKDRLTIVFGSLYLYREL